MTPGYNISLKQIYRELQKDIIEEINNNCIPQTLFLLQENFINNIQTNEYFTLEEKQAISLYLKHNSTFTEKNVNEFTNGLLNEGLKNWLGSAWGKIKNVFGNIKDFSSKIWASIKKFIVEQCKKAYSWAKGKFESLKPKIVAFMQKIKDKAQLTKEIFHIDSIYDWLKTNAYSFLNKYGQAAEKALGGEESAMGMREIIFNSNFTRILAEANEEIPTDITKPETIGILKKLGVGVEILLKTLAFVFNPFKALIAWVVKLAAPKMISGLAKFVQSLGGPKAIEYVVLPTLFTETAELMGVFNGADNLLEKALSLIPGVGPYIESILHIGHYIFITLAWYEILHEISGGLKTKSS
jgi:hypothetical protein